MSPDMLQQHLDIMADAPNGVQKLREFILQLAVRGKLVQQDPNDEPASVLLKNAGRERSTSNTDRRENASHSSTRRRTTDPHKVPTSWCWAPLGEIVDVLDSRRVPVKEAERAARIAGKSTAGLVPYYGATQQVGWIDEHLFDEELVLLGEDGAPFFRDGKNVAYVITGKSWVNNHAHVLRGVAGISNRYLCHALNVTDFHGYVTGTTRPKLTQGKLVQLRMPLAPLAEQRRIVAKVDELMTLCKELEERHQQRTDARSQLNRSALYNLTVAADDIELAEHWQRLRENFDIVYQTPEMVDEMRKAVLQLAVRGKLVPQDPNDEPASVLLERIAAEKQQLLRKGMINKPRSLLDIGKAELPFKLPNGWTWTRLGELIDPFRSLSYGVLVPGPDVDGGVPFVRLQDITGSTFATRPNKSIDPAAEANYARTRLQGGEILIGVVGSIGAVGIVPRGWAGANIARALCRFAPSANLDRDYLAWVLRSPLLQNYFLEATRTLAQPTLNVAQLEIAVIPLPPVAEQRRIVAKVHELMTLCTKLEQHLTRAREKSEHLAASIVHHLTAA